jgi:hypothetical protein
MFGDVGNYHIFKVVCAAVAAAPLFCHPLAQLLLHGFSLSCCCLLFSLKTCATAPVFTSFCFSLFSFHTYATAAAVYAVVWWLCCLSPSCCLG